MKKKYFLLGIALIAIGCTRTMIVQETSNGRIIKTRTTYYDAYGVNVRTEKYSVYASDTLVEKGRLKYKLHNNHGEPTQGYIWRINEGRTKISK